VAPDQNDSQPDMLPDLTAKDTGICLRAGIVRLFSETSMSCQKSMLPIINRSAPYFQHALYHIPITIATLHDIDYVERICQSTLCAQIFRTVPSVRAFLVIPFQPVEEIIPNVPSRAFSENDTMLPDARSMYPVRRWCSIS